MFNGVDYFDSLRVYGVHVHFFKCDYGIYIISTRLALKVNIKIQINKFNVYDIFRRRKKQQLTPKT